MSVGNKTCHIRKLLVDHWISGRVVLGPVDTQSTSFPIRVRVRVQVRVRVRVRDRVRVRVRVRVSPQPSQPSSMPTEM